MSFRPPKTLPILTIFHNPKSAQSRAALELLKRRSNVDGRDVYRVDETSEAPTKEQLNQIADYLPQQQGITAWQQMFPDMSSVQGDWSSVAKRLREEPNLLERPLVVDWARGKAVLGKPTLDAVQQLIGERLGKETQ